MDRNSQPRAVTSVIAVTTLVLAVLLTAIAPSATRVWAVAEFGVQTADAMAWVFYFAGAILALVGLFATYRLGRWLYDDMLAEQAKRHQQENPYRLPPKDETNAEVIREHLIKAATDHPAAADLINQSLGQLNSLQRDLEAIDEIFKANTGIIYQSQDEYEFPNYELMVQRVIAHTCKDLVGIIYLASVTKEATVGRLMDAVERVNSGHQAQVDAAHELAIKAAEFVPNVDYSSNPTAVAPQQLQQLIERLSDMTQEEGVL